MFNKIAGLENSKLQNCKIQKCKIQRKTSVLKSLYNKVASAKETPSQVFSIIFAKLLRIFYNKTPYILKIAYG